MVLVVSGCTTVKQVSTDISKNSLTQQEMDIASALEYIQYDNKDCTGNCTFHVSGIFEYFDDCLMVWDSKFYKSLGLDLKQKNSYYPMNFHIKKFGTIYFTKHTDSLDYYFSPVLFNKNKKSLHGQVRNRENLRFSYGINLLRGDMYISYIDGYPDNCWW